MTTPLSPIARRAADAAAAYIAPRLSPAARLSFGSVFDGVTVENFNQRLPAIVGSIVGATADQLACDASVDELRERMEQAALQPSAAAPGAGTHPGNPAINGGLTAAMIEQVLRLLAPHLHPDELAAVEELLGHEDAVDYQNATMSADSRYRGINGQLARARIERRLGVTLPRPEPSYTPAPPPRVSNASAVADFYRRFPEARGKHV